MGWWIALGVVFALIVVALAVIAKRVDRIEDDTSYVKEEVPFTRYGQTFVDILRGRDTRD